MQAMRTLGPKISHAGHKDPGPQRQLSATLGCNAAHLPVDWPTPATGRDVQKGVVTGVVLGGQWPGEAVIGVMVGTVAAVAAVLVAAVAAAVAAVLVTLCFSCLSSLIWSRPVP